MFFAGNQEVSQRRAYGTLHSGYRSSAYGKMDRTHFIYSFVRGQLNEKETYFWTPYCILYASHQVPLNRKSGCHTAVVSRFQPIILPVVFYEAQMRQRDTSTSYSAKVWLRKDSPHTPYNILELLTPFYMQKRMTFRLRNSVFRRNSQCHNIHKKETIWT